MEKTSETPRWFAAMMRNAQGKKAARTLAEMGVGTAIVYNLYKPLAEGDHEKVSQLMNLFRTAYWTIGAATFIIGIVLIMF